MKKPIKIAVAACSAGLALAGTAHAVFNPIPFDPAVYNADVVVEKTATPRLEIVTTATIDQGTNNAASTLFEIGYDTVNFTNGLPLAGSTIVALDNANYSFQMPPSYTAPNGILINTVHTNGSFNLTTPAAYRKLSFLGLGGNGGDFIGVTAYHQDGSVSRSLENGFGCPDWFGGSGVAYIMGGRINQNFNLDTQVNGNSGDGRGNPRLYFRDVTLTNSVTGTNTSSPITNVALHYISGAASSHNAILAMSGIATVGGAATPVAVTGFTHDFVVEAGAPKRGRVVSQTIVDGTNVWATSQSMDNLGNTANSWYEKGYNTNVLGSGPVSPSNPVTLAAAASSGLPAAGQNITNASGDRIYTLPASYTANNAIFLSPSNTTATLTLTAPTTASVLSFLGAAANGTHNVRVVVTHANATTETNIITVPDWFNTGLAYVYGANGRVAVDTAQFNNATNNVFTPRLFGCDVIVSSASPVTQIQLTYTNETAGRLALFALSGTVDAIAPVFVSNPVSVKTNVGFDVTFSASAIANVPISYQWQKGTNGVYVNLANGAGVSGAQSSSLVLASVPEEAEAAYRVIASTTAGSVTSVVATLTVISPLPDVTLPGDTIVAYQPNGGSSPGGEPPANAINENTTKYLNFGNVTPVSNPLGFIVTPSMGRTKVTAMRLYTANDADARDPGNVILEGSDNGGATWSLIYSNDIALPTARNDVNLAIDPIARNMLQIRFANANGYSMYRWYCTKVRGNTALMQIGEVELLGVADTSGLPSFITPPASVVAYDQSSASMFVNASGNPNPGVFWLKKNGSSYTSVVDGGGISGAQTTSLNFSPVVFAHAGEYVAVATNTSGSVTSAPAALTVITTLMDVTFPGDPITGFGDTTSNYTNDNPVAYAIDDFNTLVYRNGGSGLNAGAGFPPFAGPVGVVVTPSQGSTLVTGLRVYTATDAAERDPADYILEGSNNGGSSYTVISQGALNLPTARGDNNFGFDPTVQPMQEILFANNAAYTTYRVTFNNVRNNATANSFQIGEIELLGVAAAAQPNLTITSSGGTLTITTTIDGTLQSRTNLATGTWENEGPITGSVNIVPNPAVPVKFYRVVVP